MAANVRAAELRELLLHPCKLYLQRIHGLALLAAAIADFGLRIA